MNRLYIGNIPYDTTNQNLRDLFSEFGEITQTKIIIDRDTQRSRGFGFVEFKNEDGAKAATALNGTEYGGRKMIVSIANEKGAAPKGGQKAKKPRTRENRSE